MNKFSLSDIGDLKSQFKKYKPCRTTALAAADKLILPLKWDASNALRGVSNVGKRLD